MFTGIIAAIGTVTAMEKSGMDLTVTLATGKLDLSDTAPGDSIAVNGVCLTVTEMTDDGFSTDVSTETLSCTTFASLQIGDRINLEKALQLSDRLGGHIVSGHVDGIGIVNGFQDEGRSVRYQIGYPPALRRYLCRKGSVCVDGVSLTINEVTSTAIELNIIPHTMTETIFGDYRKGTEVNLEIDIIARYLESLHTSGGQ